MSSRSRPLIISTPHSGTNADIAPSTTHVHRSRSLTDIAGTLTTQNDVESLRLRTGEHEMIIALHDNFTLVVVQQVRGMARSTTEATCSGITALIVQQ